MGVFINIREARGASSTSSLSLSSQPKCLELSIQVYWVKEPNQLVEQHRSQSEYVCFRCGNQPTGIHTHTHTHLHTHTDNRCLARAYAKTSFWFFGTQTRLELVSSCVACGQTFVWNAFAFWFALLLPLLLLPLSLSLLLLLLLLSVLFMGAGFVWPLAGDRLRLRLTWDSYRRARSKFCRAWRSCKTWTSVV